MEYALNKYKFYIDKKHRTVIAASTYAGKTVKGRAKADPRDEFDIEKGKELAAARCNEKIANKRLARANKKVIAAQRQLEEARAYYIRMTDYFNDAQADAGQASMKTQSIKKNLD